MPTSPQPGIVRGEAGGGWEKPTQRGGDIGAECVEQFMLQGAKAQHRDETCAKGCYDMIVNSRMPYHRQGPSAWGVLLLLL